MASGCVHLIVDNWLANPYLRPNPARREGTIRPAALASTPRCYLADIKATPAGGNNPLTRRRYAHHPHGTKRRGGHHQVLPERPARWPSPHCQVLSSPQFGQDGEEFLDVSVIYEGQREALKPYVLNAVYWNICPQLLDNGIDHVPSIGCIPNHEWVPPPRLTPKLQIVASNPKLGRR